MSEPALAERSTPATITPESITSESTTPESTRPALAAPEPSMHTSGQTAVPPPRGQETHRDDSSGLLHKLRWRINRLSCMSAAEVRHRVGRSVRMHWQSMGLSADLAVPAPDLERRPRAWVHQPASGSINAAACMDAADRIAAGRFDVFALQDVVLGSPPEWNRDPKTGTRAPLGFGKLLDYRQPRLVGDIKYLWEPNRHLHLVTLAQAYALSREARYAEVLRAHLESWFQACPPGRGPNWASSLELGIRLINWAVAWQLLGGANAAVFDGASGAAFRRRWLDSVFQHAEFIRGHFSLYSSANNHLIGEAAGLFIAAVCWPHWARADGWLSQARGILEREARRQNAADGVNLEQAVSYQQFVLDLLLLPMLAGRVNRNGFSAGYEARLVGMLEYLASVMDAGGNVPMIGDADDAHAVRLAPSAEFCNYRSLLATGALLFGRGDFKSKAGALDDKTRWLLGGEADVDYARLGSGGAAALPRQSFPDGGYYVLGCDFETAREIRAVADAGPLGYERIAAHGHADALSFTLSLGGVDVLVDPGTYAYHTQSEWRNYFRGTSAHNTLRVDGADQSEPGGNFMWLKKARAGCAQWSSSQDRDVFEGWHDGYTRLADPVLHHRRISLDKAARSLVLEDALEMSGRHDVELFFHCNERCLVEQVERFTFRIGVAGGPAFLLKLPPLDGAACEVRTGSVAPISGWVSRRFDEKRPAPTLVWRAVLRGAAGLRTEIMC